MIPNSEFFDMYAEMDAVDWEMDFRTINTSTGNQDVWFVCKPAWPEAGDFHSSSMIHASIVMDALKSLDERFRQAAAEVRSRSCAQSESVFGE